jgi:hypothetical protein
MRRHQPENTDAERGRAGAAVTSGAVRLAGQGCSWVGVTCDGRDGRTVADGSQLYVEFQQPEEQTRPWPSSSPRRARSPLISPGTDDPWAPPEGRTVR